MRIPKSVKIGGFNYDIILGDIAANRDKYGEISTLYSTITIEKNMTHQKQEETLLHEVLESIDSHYELDLKHSVLQTICFAMIQVVRDNKLYFGQEDENE